MSKNRRPACAFLPLPRALLAALALLGALTTANAADIPPSLRDRVLAARQREVVALEILGVKFESLQPFARQPYIFWRADGSPTAPFVRDVQAGASWIHAAAEALGHHDFEPRYVGTWHWRDDEVWSYELVRKGVPLFDLRVDLHWQGERFVGVVNGLVGAIASIEELASGSAPAEDAIYFPRLTDGSYAVQLGRIRRVVDAERGLSTVVTVGGTTAATILTPLKHKVKVGTIQEYIVPVGNFPDQIDVDSAGKVWFSQPNQNFLTRFDPTSATFQQFPTPGASGPDGMIVDSQDRVWSGMYYNGGALGKLTISSSAFQSFAPPYASAAMAIPLETSQGRIWVTDHQQNRISEFDPTTNAWMQSLVMPTPGCWVVAGTEDVGNGQLYFTEFSANKLGRTSLAGGSVQDIQTPGGGPAFLGWSHGNVYYSQWNLSRMGVYSTASGQIVEIDHPIPNELGGPLAIAPNGDVVIGTRNAGYILVFHISSSTWSSFKIPTSSFANLKDGITVGPNGVIWFTETGANKLGKLVLF